MEVRKKMDTPKYINEKKVAAIMDCAVQTLRNKRFKGEGPPYSKIGRAVRYSERDVIQYMEARKVTPTGE